MPRCITAMSSSWAAMVKMPRAMMARTPMTLTTNFQSFLFLIFRVSNRLTSAVMMVTVPTAVFT